MKAPISGWVAEFAVMVSFVYHLIYVLRQGKIIVCFHSHNFTMRFSFVCVDSTALLYDTISLKNRIKVLVSHMESSHRVNVPLSTT